jgi:hypothetical protein
MQNGHINDPFQKDTPPPIITAVSV